MLELQTVYVSIKIYTSNRFKQVMTYLIKRNKNLEAVSYTHLDVYKRQHTILLIQLLSLGHLASNTLFNPASSSS